MSLRPRIAALGTLALLLVVGCSENTLLGDPSGAPPTRVNATIEVTLPTGDDASVIDFGDVTLGESAVAEVLIRSVGTDTLQLQDVSVEAPGVELVSLDPEAFLLAPGEQATALLRYTPTSDGLLNGLLRVGSNDRQRPLVSVDLRGDGLGPALTVFPPGFDFGDLEIGCSSNLTVELRNEGRAPLTIDAVDLEQLGGGGEVTLTTALTLPIELDPGTAALVEIDYAPTDAIADSSTLTVQSNDPAVPEGATAVQFGVGHLGETNEDLFEQGGLGLTDILFVVDNSCSMGDEQTTFAVNFPAFVPILEASGTDFKLAATTTDAGDNGAFVGATPIITPSTPDPAGTFGANVTLGTSGAGYEQAMLGGWLALNPAYAANPGFLRDIAGLRIIFVSDAVDFSTDAGMPFQSPGDYAAAFQSLKQDPSKVILSDISGGLSGCSGPGGSAQASTNLTTATQLTGGISASICDANWVASLSALAWLSTSINDTFLLTEPALENTIEVNMNGAAVFSGWFFDPALNAVVFDGAYIPDEGDELIISYGLAGGCEG
ncbi:MAG: choice-of-anchor D domain-containing protein [Deltaproteobacteria bacterium]|nr:choice-of-anchor D domain-containing protein [Deltaproteobacteria bacterium]